MNTRTKTTLIQLAGLLLCLVCAFAGVFWHFEKTAGQTDSTDTPQNDVVENIQSEYDPIAQIINVPATEETGSKNYDYYEAAKNYHMIKTLKGEGYKLSSVSYDANAHKVGIVSSGMEFPKEISQLKRRVDVSVMYEKNAYGYHYRTETQTEDCPVLVPYYGYVIYTANGICRLLDGELNVLVNNFSGYSPAYMTDYNGNPLFEKDGRYYFYYDGKDYDGVVYTDIDNDSYSKLPVNAPDAYKYFDYDVEMLHNLFVTNDFNNEANMTGIVYILPENAGMAEFAVGEEQLENLRLTSDPSNRIGGGLFRFPSYTYTKKEEKNIDGQPYYSYKVTKVLWGYMDANGKVVIEPRYQSAFDFSSDGYAVAENEYNRIFLIDRRGGVVLNYSQRTYNFSGAGAQSIADGHFMPDTYGVENTGMLYLDKGYIRMRRKLIDTENAYTVTREYDMVVNAAGGEVTLPQDCSVVAYSDGVLLVKRGELYGYIGTDGSWIVEPTLVYAKPFSEGLAVMGYAEGKLGVIDTEGNYVLYPMYSHIESCSGGVITAYSSVGGWSVFNKMSTVEQTVISNPIIALKERAIAEARDRYYNKETQEIENIKGETEKDELPGGQS
ncbi:MAG: WG repeat-containing protein [Clostridia bacterium]|nr:WG repeat-containing protein [Clostridia bacterium]